MTDYTKASAYLDPGSAEAEEAMAAIIGNASGSERMERALLPYQQHAVSLLESGCKVLVVEKSRRIGMTWGLAAEAVLRAARRKKSGGMDWLYISYSQDMTKEFIDACAMWARLFSIAAGAASEFLFEDKKEEEETRSIKAYRIDFASKRKIIGLSSAPRALRGKQGVVMIDEAAFVDSLPELLKSALALRMWGGQIIVCSTHNGTENPFNAIIRDIHSKKKNYQHMFVDFDMALAQGLYQRIAQTSGEEWSPEKQLEWRDEIVSDYGDAAQEELFCVPSQGSGTWLSTALIQRQMTEQASKIIRWQWDKDYLTWDAGRQKTYLAAKLRELDPLLAALNKQHQHAMGFDFARVANGDLSVLDVTSIDHVLNRGTGLVLEMRGVPYEEQHQITKHIWDSLPRRKGAAFDATGAGGYVAEALSRRYGLYDQKLESGGMVAEIKFSVDWYRQHMPKLKAAFEEGTVAIPRDDLIEGDLLAVKVVQGVAMVPALRTGSEGLKRHGDYAVAKALSWYATLMNTAEYDYESAGAASTAQRDRFNTPHDDDFRRGDDDWRTPLGADITGSL